MTFSGFATDWTSAGAADQQQGQSFEVKFSVELMGERTEEGVLLQGETKVVNRRLERYLQKLEKENDWNHSQYDSQPQPPSQGEEFQQTDSFSSFGLNILKSGFKLRMLDPVLPTRKVTVEAFLGEDEDFPSLEAIDQRLNPFKFTELEVLDSSFTARDMRKLQFKVSVKEVGDSIKAEEFKGTLDGYLILADFYPHQDF